MFLRFGTQEPTSRPENVSFCLNELQEKAKVLLTSNSSQQLEFDENVKILYQMIEDFIRETDRYMETERKTREDLYSQVKIN